jgi:hypothetical protein
VKPRVTQFHAEKKLALDPGVAKSGHKSKKSFLRRFFSKKRLPYLSA